MPSVYDLLRRDSYYKEETCRKESSMRFNSEGQSYNRGQSRNHKFSRNYLQQPYGNEPISDKKLTRTAGKFNKKGAEALKCYDCGYTPFTYSQKAVCKNNPNNIKRNNKNRYKNFIVSTSAATMDTDDSSSDNDENEQRFAVATIVPKKKRKEASSKIDTDDSECKHFDSNYFRKMPNNNTNTNGLLYLPVILETNVGIKVTVK